MNLVKEQLGFWGVSESKVVNVSSVPQRSPFRYPGGKTWLIPYIRQWLKSSVFSDRTLIEPFAGGAIVTLSAVAEKRVKEALFVEIDEDVAAVWQAILGDDATWLAKRIVSFELTRESAERVLSSKSQKPRDRAFAVLLKNRVSHGGILANGAGLLKHGENGKGIHSRWYPKTLRKRILDIQTYREKLTFLQGDAFDVMAQNANRTDAVFFIDPPYTVAGKRLYRYPNVDHARVFQLAADLKSPFLITYDNAEDILQLAAHHKFQVAKVPMTGTHLSRRLELLISRDLSWLKRL
jgi:DNA adenine methylase